MSNEIKNQAQKPEVENDGELNEDALTSVAGGLSFNEILNRRMQPTNTTGTTSTTSTTTTP
jgi:hypothetical protein